MIIKNRLVLPIILFIISLFVIIIGIVLTISIVFFFIGIPIIIVGLIIMLISILSFFGATIDSIFSLFKPKKFKVDIKESKNKKKKTRRKIIDVEEKEGVYTAEK